MQRGRLHPAIRFLSVILVTASSLIGGPAVMRPDIEVGFLANAPSHPVRIAKDPRDSSLYLLLLNGEIHRLEPTEAALTRVYSAQDHGQHSAQGFAVGPDGSFYVVGNEIADGYTVSSVVRGIPSETGGREWHVVAQTEPYPRSNTAFDHVFNSVVVSPDGGYLLVNSGSRTDHGEVQSAGGRFPGVREVPLTAKIFRLPADGRDLLLRNDEAFLRAEGLVFADGVRNAFSMAFDGIGNLFATENGPDRDDHDGLLWVREGRHYGFPWRIGGADNPQQFPDYDPSQDLLLNASFIAVSSGFYHNDPEFPTPPKGISFEDPVLNFGPDAVSYRDPATGGIRNGAEDGKGIRSFTGHRSPLGLIFDTSGILADPFRNGAFVLGWTEGDPFGDSLPGPFADPGQDLLHLALRQAGDNYEMNATRIVGGFSNPVDAEIVGNRIYVIEHGGSFGVWEVTLPATLSLSLVSRDNATLRFHATGPAGVNMTLENSTDLTTWHPIRVLANPLGVAEFDQAAPEHDRGFYRLRLEK